MKQTLDTILDGLFAERAQNISICLSHDDTDDLCSEMIEDLDSGTSVQYDGHSYRDVPLRAGEFVRSHVQFTKSEADAAETLYLDFIAAE